MFFVLFFGTCSSAKTDTTATLFLYDYHQGQDGSSFSKTPFYMSGVGIIKDQVKLKDELKKFKGKVADEENGLDSIKFDFLLERFEVPAESIPKEIKDSGYNLEGVLFTASLTKSSKGEKFLLFLEKKVNGENAIVGVLSELSGDQRKSIEQIINKKKVKP